MAAIIACRMQRKILIMGLPGAGKTTLANVLAPLLNAVVFNAGEDASRPRSVRIDKTPVR
jgi:MoxR-like ATPase